MGVGFVRPSPGRQHAWRWLALLLALPPLACSFAPEAPESLVTRAPAPTETASPFTGEPALAPSAVREPLPAFAPFEEASVSIRAEAATYEIGLDGLANPDFLGRLTAEQQLLLNDRGNVAVPGTARQPFEFYQQATASGAPIIITTDAILATGSALFRAVEVRTVRGHLDPILVETSRAMALQSLAQYRALPEGPTQEAAWRNLAFFSLATRLVNPAFVPADEVAGIVTDELTLIEGHAGTFLSPLFGEPHDYDRYRGLAPGPALGRDWYQAHALRFSGDPVSDRTLARQLLLMGHALASSGQAADWERYVAVKAFLDGSDPADLSLRDVASAARAVFAGWPDPATLASVASLDDFVATLSQLGTDVGFRWLTRPRSPDASLYARLLFNQVGVADGVPASIPFTGIETPIGIIRGVPHGLDMAAAWQVPGAARELAASGDDGYEGFAAQLATLQGEIQARPSWEWTSNLSGGWLYTLEALRSDPGAPPPLPFGAETGWESRTLSSWVGGWAFVHLPAGLAVEEAEDGVLATPLPAAADVSGYVESYPLLYARMAALVSQTRTGLAEKKMLDDDLADRLARFEALLEELVAVTARQAANPKTLTPADAALYRAFGDTLEKILTLADGRAAPPLVAVAAIYENPNTGFGLQIGLGEAWELYAIVPIAGQPTLALGLATSVYQFKAPIGQGWQADPWSAAAERPAPAPWTQQYYSP